MKRFVLRMIMTLLGVAGALNIYAYDFEVDGIYYNILSSTDLTVEVAPKNGDDILGPLGTLMEKAPYNIDAYKGVVNIPEKIKYKDLTYNVIGIGSRAFIQCVNLVDVIIPPSVESIGDEAFWNCKKLKRLYIPKSVKRITFYNTGYGSCENYFYGCDSLEEIKVEEGNTVYDSRDNCNAINCYRTTIPFNITESVLIFAPATTMSIPNTIDVISGAFLNSRIKNLDIPPSVKRIEEYSFYDSEVLEKVRILDGSDKLILEPVYSLKYDAYGTFRDCSLKSIYIGRPIDYNCHLYSFSPFDGCRQLEYVEFGDMVKDIMEYLYDLILFEECTKLETVVLGKNISNIGNAFSKCENIKSISIRNIVPPNVSVDFLDAIYTTATLNIPKGSLEAYKSHSIWGKFLNIIETLDFSNVDSVEYDAQVDVYNMQGVVVRKGVQHSEATQGLPQGIYIINGEKVLVK